MGKSFCLGRCKQEVNTAELSFRQCSVVHLTTVQCCTLYHSVCRLYTGVSVEAARTGWGLC